MEREELISLIEKVFPLKPRPDMTIHQGQLADQSLDREISEAEWESEGRKDRDRTWKELSDPDIDRLDSALSHLDETGFVYYIPAYMVFSLKYLESDWNEFGWDTVGSTVFHLSNRSGYNIGRLKALSYDQIDVVTEFLRFVRDNKEEESRAANIALEKYWETGEAKRKIGERFP